jgi:hypothetical protein
LDGITPFNAKKQSKAALTAFERVMNQAARFSATVKQYDGYIKELKQAKAETQSRIEAAEHSGEILALAVQIDIQKTVDSKDRELAEKEREIRAARHEAYLAADKLRRQASNIDHIFGRMPLEMRVRFFEERDKVAAINAAKSKNERGKAVFDKIKVTRWVPKSCAVGLQKGEPLLSPEKSSTLLDV